MANELLENLDRLHTTELGVIRIKKNLSLNVENVIEWCKEKISLSNAKIIRKGKNWYITWRYIKTGQSIPAGNL